MIKFLDLQAVNARYRDEMLAAMTRVLDSGWYIQGAECAAFEQEFAAYCGSRHAIGVANGLDALVLILRAYKELGWLRDGVEYLYCVYFGHQSQWFDSRFGGADSRYFFAGSRAN